jgi:hypothetical protein
VFSYNGTLTQLMALTNHNTPEVLSGLGWTELEAPANGVLPLAAPHGRRCERCGFVFFASFSDF